MNRWLPALLLSLAIIFGLQILYSRSTHHSYLNESLHPNSNYYDPGQTQRQAIPSNQPGEVAPSATPLTPAWQKGVTLSQATTHLEIGTARSTPAFDTTELSVHPGEIVSLTLRNDSDPSLHYTHGLIVSNPGTQGEVMIAAERAGAAEDYVPQSPNLLVRTQMLKSGESDTVVFRAPTAPGDYPYFCPFPGHGNVMSGVLHVRAG